MYLMRVFGGVKLATCCMRLNCLGPLLNLVHEIHQWYVHPELSRYDTLMFESVAFLDGSFVDVCGALILRSLPPCFAVSSN